ncbi:MAG: hypothetical protein U1E97_06080 [Alphaproteobacteria bacterium]
MSGADASQRIARRRMQPALVFGALGAISGAVIVGLKVALDHAGLDLHKGLAVFGFDLSLDDLSLYPGLVFGIVIGVALLRRGLASAAQAAGYVVAAMLANFAATNLAYTLYEGRHGLAIGLAAGALGAASLTALTLAILPFSRRLRPCVLMVAAGTALGALLSITLDLIERDTVSAYLGLLVLYVPWQGAFAAAFGHSLDDPKIRADAVRTKLAERGAERDVADAVSWSRKERP